MTDEEAFQLINVMAAAYGPPEQDQQTLWMSVLGVLDYDRGHAAVERWVLTERWWPRPADINEAVTELGEHMRFRQERALPPRTCDGTGWRAIPEGNMPCDVCNPALHRIFSDHDLLSRWRAGQDPKSLIDLGQFVQPEGYCQPDTIHEDPTDPSVSPVRGREIAAAAYEADCERRSVEPNWNHFDHSIGGT